MLLPVSVRLQLLFAGLLMLGATGPISAQRGMLGGMGGEGIDQRPIRIVVDAGLTVPSGEFKAKHENGFHYGAMLIVAIPGFPIAIRPEVSLTQYKMKKPFSTTPVYGDFKNTNTVSGLGNIEVPIAGGLYVLGGAGILSLKSDTTTLGSQLAATNLLLDVGGGFRFRLGDHVDGYLEARMGTASFDKARFGYAKAQFVPLTFGLVF
ncbi:MAG: hypothetical protein ABI852_14235 [Gemmatimonadaceae bacterium]